MAGTYNFALFLLSRRKVPHHPNSGDQRFYVFLLACLNEEKVLAESLARITALPAENCVALVIDDASDDRTAEIARTADPERVWLHQRRLPNARRGKGAALNDGVG